MNVAALRRTPFYEQHEELGAKLVPFAGWEMPVLYEGIREEHTAVRTHAGMFDVSHMGEVEVEGPGALAFLQLVLSNDVSKVAVGGAQYSCLCNETGGVIDDLFAYRLGSDRFLIVTNAANHETDLAWLGRWSRDHDVAVRDVADRYAMLAVQGPHARAVVGRALGIDLPERFHVAAHNVGRRPALICGTGYTGEDGVEMLIDPEVAIPIFKELRDAGVVPCGPRRPRHPAAGGLLSAARQRADAGAQPDRGRPRLVLQGGDGFHRLAGDTYGARRGHRRAPRPVHDRGRRHPPRRQPGSRGARRGRRHGDQRHLRALAGDRRRDGLRRRRARRAGDRGRDRRARQASSRPDSVQASLPEMTNRTIINRIRS